MVVLSRRKPQVVAAPGTIVAEPADGPERQNDMHGSRVTILVCLLAVLAGCGSATGSLNGSTHGNEGKVSVSSSSPASPPPRGSVTVTEADRGATIWLRIGQRLRVVLGGHGEQWVTPASDGPAVRRTAASGGYPTGQAADAVFLAVRVGTASVNSMTDYACLHAQPPCKIPQRTWALRVVVTQSS